MDNSNHLDAKSDNLTLEEKYMTRALELAALGRGHTSPNPMVGAVIVKNNEIIGEGYHHQAGEPHAEVNAFFDAANRGNKVEGATLYVTLEPCAHFGKTPPCANRVVDEGIKKVVIGTKDPNPLVAGKGIEILEKAGIEVTVGILEKECSHLNEQFLTSFLTGIPFITLKSAMSLDGKIATSLGESKWITNEVSRLDGHYLRAIHDVILTGVGTILADNPTLNIRVPEDKVEDFPIKNPQNPVLVILDHYGRTPLEANIWQVSGRKIIIFVAADCNKEKIYQLEGKGAEVISLEDYSLLNILHILQTMKYLSVLVEGGSKIISSFVEEKLVDKIITYIGDKIIGGEDAIPAVGGVGFSHLQEALPLHFKSVCLQANNIRIEAYYAERKGSYVHGDN